MTPKALTSFTRLSDGNFESKVNTVTDSMRSNPNFVTPVPSLAILDVAAANYSSALATASSGNRSDIAIKNSRRQEMTDLLQSLVEYVNFTAAGIRSVLLTSGFDITSDASATAVSKPENMQATNGMNPGDLQLSVAAVKGARCYTHEIVLDDETAGQTWQAVTSTACRYLFTDLQAGKKYICRVGAVGSKGQLVYSDLVSRIVI